MPRYLLDASALYPLLLQLREKILDYASLFTVLDLTVYEVGNTVWKEYQRGRVKNPYIVAKLFQEILSLMNVVSINGRLGDVLELAHRENLTFYDASYLYTATRMGLKLVTEDKALQKYPVSISVKELLVLLGSGQKQG